MAISFELPPDIEDQLRADGADLDADAREAYLVDLYREDRITHRQLAEALDLGRLETDVVLKRRQVSIVPGFEEIRAEFGSLRETRSE